ncbi:MAG TPA: response regulator transcription factor [Mycobacteriales bacterium]|nr:response regulator transcription factor [Mycobacteriales bacterium]
MGTLLVVEDDETIGSLLQEGLSAHGHEVTWARGGRSALRDATVAQFDLVLLDLGLPDLDGVEVCRQLRLRQPGCVIVMLTARKDEMDVVVGLEAGADDYLTKPFRFAELRARVHAHLRRGPSSPPRQPVESVGALTVDTAARRCQVGGVEVPLRAKEFDLLARLAADPGVALSRETLMSDVWDEHWSGSTKTLDVHVAALRRRLDEAAAAAGVGPVRITTLRGHGYRLEAA